jgi:cell wall-associated NlpC family hydrolase
MTARVSYYPKSIKTLGASLLLGLLLATGLAPLPGRLGVMAVSAKPMPAIESAWVAMQSQLALDALEAAENVSAVEQKDVASRWVNSIAKIIAEHLEISSKELTQSWQQSGIDRQKVLFSALTQLGVPYKTNADEPGRALDCSALIKFAWSNAGLKMPRGSAQQYAVGERVKASEVQLGDLAWYPGHISMSLGFQNIVIQAPTNGRNVEVHEINESRINWVRWVDPTQ